MNFALQWSGVQLLLFARVPEVYVYLFFSVASGIVRGHYYIIACNLPYTDTIQYFMFTDQVYNSVLPDAHTNATNLLGMLTPVLFLF